ncbi:MAG: alpha/beta fold hydrolase [Anaerolineae bacterium]|nr:alpha/beta fold hydrolase [Anaerolineae bacterium]
MSGERHVPDPRHLAGLITHRYADLPEVRLHYVEAGRGPLVVLLHGFPEAWFAWQHQIPALVAAGLRVVAPDMRGYNLSDKPAGVASYALDRLADDVAALIRWCGAEQASVVGHDWGAVVAWAFAMRHPEMLTRLAILNVPHPARMARGLRTLRQLRKSWYMFFFQLPWLPEAAFRAGDYAFLRATLRRDPVRARAFSDEDIERYVAAAAQPGALTAGMNYYRWIIRHPRAAFAGLRRIEAPVLVIWGEQDRYLGPELAEPGKKWVPNCRVERLPDASHWVQADAAERVNELLVGFLAVGASS